MLQKVSPELRANLIDSLDLALREDQANADLSSAALPLDAEAEGTFLIKQRGVLAGFALLEGLADSTWIRTQGEAAPDFTLMMADGDEVQRGDIPATLRAKASLLLKLERSMLNLISHLSGVATLTRHFVNAVAESKAAICDTRKTLPGMRMAQKYAVICGGGTSHRFSLADQAMIKENHLALSGLSIREAIAAIRAKGDQRLTCECESLGQVQEAIEAGADCVLLDNFSLSSLRQALSLRRSLGMTSVPFEASGGVNLNSVGAIAATGVERISVGALTHSAPSLDISFKIHLV